MIFPAPAEALRTGKSAWFVSCLISFDLLSIGIEVEFAVSVGTEIDLIPEPHRIGIIASPFGLGDFLERIVACFQDPDFGRRPAAVVLPLHVGEAVDQRVIGDSGFRRETSRP